MTRNFTTLLVCASTASSLGAEIQPFQQSRSVYARTATDEDVVAEDTVYATDFGQFSASIGFDAGSADQDSSVGTSVITATGDASGTRFVTSGPNRSLVYGSGRSSFSLTFTLTETSAFEFSGVVSTDRSLPSDGAIAWTRFIGFDDNGPQILFEVPFGEAGPTSVPFTASGVLTPGTYLLDAQAWAWGPQVDSPASAAFDVTIAFVPEPASAMLCMIAGFGLSRGRRS